MPGIIEIHRAIAYEAGATFEPHRLQSAALEGRVPYVVRQPGRNADTGFLFDVEPGREADLAAWLREHIEAVSGFSMFTKDRDMTLPVLSRADGWTDGSRFAAPKDAI